MDMSTAAAPGLRERKKAETRQAVHQAALRLAVEHGLENVTVEAIADAANISRRTFSNYFAGKEDALLYGEEQRFRTLVASVRARPAAENGWQALRGAVEETYGRFGTAEKEWAVRTRLARRHPSLLARQMANLAQLERELGEAVAERGAGPDLASRVMVATCLTTLRVATHRWLDEEQARPLTAVIRAALDELERPFG